MQVPFSPPDIREEDIDAVVKVLRSGWITSGPVGEEFRNSLTEYCGSANTILMNSATAAMEMALHALGVGPGDEVIVPAYTYTASASVIAHVGAKIVMVDVEPGEYFVKPETWKAAITENTKALIAVDLGGVMVDAPGLIKIAEESRSVFRPRTQAQKQLGRIAVIIDGAHSLGAIHKGNRAGSLGDFTAFSFHAVKNLTTAEGGALTWRKDLPIDDEELLKTLKLLILHGQSKSALEKTNSASWEYDVAFPGYKANMADIMAALGLSQLKRYESVIARRQDIIRHYDETLLPLGLSSLTHQGEDFRSSGHLYLLGLEGRDLEFRNNFIEEMFQAGISCNVHYKPLPLLTAYRNLGFKIEDYPQAYAQYIKQVTLPLHTCLTDEQVVYVADTAKSLLS